MWKYCFNTIIFTTSLSIAIAQGRSQTLTPVSFLDVTIKDSFWKPRMDSVATATLRACVDYTETKTGRIRNFEKAARNIGEQHEGYFYDDSDIYKALEAMAYSLQNHPDRAMEAKADEWIKKIAAAQMPDGYLNTYYQLIGLDKRWTDMANHETYCAGHLLEAAIAYKNTTGKSALLDVAVKFVHHIDSTLRLANRHWVTGHEEIELALMKLYHHTNNKRYLDMAEWFIEQRGHGYGVGTIWPYKENLPYCQDDKPIREQTDATGHAVRAMYLYAGVADVAIVTGNKGYLNAMDAVWTDVVHRNMYITGGIGGSSGNEGFSKDYELPNEKAYCETCASVGMTFWNHRLNLLTGQAKYIDVLERTLYNGALAGLSLSGDQFFYGNPLASSGSYVRSEWFGTACCPANIARLVASLGNYIYATSPDALWVNLYIGNEAKIHTDGKIMHVKMKTDYPWNGATELEVGTSSRKKMTFHLRIPGWLKQPVPGDLYSYQNNETEQPVISVNGVPIKIDMQDGYAVITRTWRKGDRISINFPMTVKEMVSNPRLSQNKDRIALQYGPLVYCVEGKNNDGKAWNFALPSENKFNVVYDKGLLHGIQKIEFTGLVPEVSSDGKNLKIKPKKITAIPYYSWSNRGASPMRLWLPTSFKGVKISD